MSDIIKSASKIVFILMAVAACAALFARILEPKDFMLLAGMAFGFYFANKGETKLPYAGK
jgi:uncharacterized membrane protein